VYAAYEDQMSSNAILPKSCRDLRNFPTPKFTRLEPHYPALAAYGRPSNSQRVVLEEKSNVIRVSPKEYRVVRRVHVGYRAITIHSSNTMLSYMPV
jgi:hypothetical protein